jgi:hypothetical protein
MPAKPSARWVRTSPQNATAVTSPASANLEKQKEGKKKMRQFGKMDIPQEAFIAALKVDS